MILNAELWISIVEGFYAACSSNIGVVVNTRVDNDFVIGGTSWETFAPNQSFRIK